jgi:hypothetical protein
MSEFPADDSAGEALPQSDRLQILSPEEYELLWGFPRFTQSDRDLFFTLTAPERGAVEQCRSVRTKIHLLLHLGYFRARQRFFRFELPAVRGDVDYLRRRYFDNVAVADLSVSLHTRQRHIEVILGLFRYRLCALEERAMLEGHARHAVRISSRPVYVAQGGRRVPQLCGQQPRLHPQLRRAFSTEGSHLNSLCGIDGQPGDQQAHGQASADAVVPARRPPALAVPHPGAQRGA